MARNAAPAGAEFLQEVARLARMGLGKGEIARRLGFRGPTPFINRLVKSSQQSGKPIPAFPHGPKRARRMPVETVQITPRGRGPAFGLNIPQEPLERLGAKPGDTLSVTVARRRIVLALASVEQAAKPSRAPRLVKRRKGG